MYTSYFFIGVAGTGMSAIAQYLKGCGKQVAGSDRLFLQEKDSPLQKQLEAAGITCHAQDGSGITADTDVVVISTAIEDTNVEIIKAKSLNIPIIKRSALLADISKQKKTIAVGGTSGKSTTTAMIFHIMQQAGLSPSLITGAGLSDLQKQGLIGNAYVGKSDYLIIEADESDGSIVGYTPTVGLLLNIERDHKEEDELISLFTTFKNNTSTTFIVNSDDKLAKELSMDMKYDFSCASGSSAGYVGSDFKQEGFGISFLVNGIPCQLHAIGVHNMQNALAAIAATCSVGVDINTAIEALNSYNGIYRRTQLVGKTANSNITVIDDFAHNPSEVAAAIASCQNIAPRVVAYFQPHGFGPLRFMHEELSRLVAETLRDEDVFVIGDVYYAGGTVDKNISPTIVSEYILSQNKKVIFAGNKASTLEQLKTLAAPNSVFLVMGARDPNLDAFAKQIFDAVC